LRNASNACFLTLSVLHPVQIGILAAAGKLCDPCLYFQPSVLHLVFSIRAAPALAIAIQPMRSTDAETALARRIESRNEAVEYHRPMMETLRARDASRATDGRYPHTV